MIAKDPKTDLNPGLKANHIRSIFFMNIKNGVMSVNAIIGNYSEQIQEGIHSGAFLRFYRKGFWSEQLLGTSGSW